MRVIFKGSFIIFLLIQLFNGTSLEILNVILILLIIASNILRVKYVDSRLTMTLEFFLITAGVVINPIYAILYGMLTYDMVYKGFYLGVFPSIGITLFYLEPRYSQWLLFLLFLCSYFAYISQGLRIKEKKLKESYDNERRVRYELEEAKGKLLASSKEIAYFAEIKERNRIAGEIHDNVGHSIAGLLMQLQVAEKLHQKDPEKSQEMLKKSVQGLAEALIMLRETVHNIKPKENIGIDYINSIIENFQFCPVTLKTVGNFNRLAPNHLEIVSYNIKEALTNASKYSQATHIEIKLETNEHFTRLYIKDNGIGCNHVEENMGLAGMRERIRNIGGTISISGSNGFLIVCVIPTENFGGGIIEGSNCGR